MARGDGVGTWAGNAPNGGNTREGVGDAPARSEMEGTRFCWVAVALEVPAAPTGLPQCLAAGAARACCHEPLLPSSQRPEASRDVGCAEGEAGEGERSFGVSPRMFAAHADFTRGSACRVGPVQLVLLLIIRPTSSK